MGRAHRPSLDAKNKKLKDADDLKGVLASEDFEKYDLGKTEGDEILTEKELQILNGS